jgi:predicted alpha/beta hydrolase
MRCARSSRNTRCEHAAIRYRYRPRRTRAGGTPGARGAEPGGWRAPRIGREQRFAHLPLFTLGHSVGGQLIGCMDNHGRARAHVMLASSTGYWRRQRVQFRYLALIFWKVYGPLMLRRRGYIPRGVVWTGESLPPGVFLQAGARVRSIGHHGFFAERHRESLWRGVLDWLDARGA